MTQKVRKAIDSPLMTWAVVTVAPSSRTLRNKSYKFMGEHTKNA